MKNDTMPYISQHDAIISRLDYWQMKDGTAHFYPTDAFEGKVDTFNDLKLIYAPKHPPMGLKGKDLSTVLREIDGKVVGYTSNTSVNKSGAVNLRSVFNITDPEIDRKIRNGELSMSLGFWYQAPGYGRLDAVNGDHVLLYEKSSGIPQGDPGALMLNQCTETGSIGYLTGEFGEDSMTADDFKNGMGEVISLIKQNQDEFNSKFLEQESKRLELESALASEKDTVLKLNTAIEEKDKLIAELQAQVNDIANKAEIDKAQRIKTNQDNYWNGLPDVVREKFESRKDELCDVELGIKLHQDIDSFLLTIPKPKFQKAEGEAEADPQMKANQDLSPEDRVAEWNAKKVRF